MSEWILGDKGADKICALADLLMNKKKEAYNQVHNVNFKDFSPWMSSSSVAEIVLPDVLKLIPNKRVNFSKEYLETVNNIILNCEDAILYVKGQMEADSLQIDIGISSTKVKSEKFYDDTYQTMKNLMPWLGRIADKFVFSILPLASKKPFNAGSVSTHLTLGVLYIADKRKTSEFPFVENLIAYAHEIGHQILNIYQYGDMIINGDHNQPIYSPVRKTNRPAIMAFHATVALAYMLKMSDAILQSKDQFSGSEVFYIKEEYKKRIKHMDLAIKELETLNLTPLGTRILREIKNMQYSCS